MRHVDTMPWAGVWPWSKRCKARKRNEEGMFYGRCELKPHLPTVDHCLERGMIWVRWKDGEVYFTEPQYEIVPEEDPVICRGGNYGRPQHPRCHVPFVPHQPHIMPKESDGGDEEAGSQVS